MFAQALLTKGPAVNECLGCGAFSHIHLHHSAVESSVRILSESVDAFSLIAALTVVRLKITGLQRGGAISNASDEIFPRLRY